MTLGNYRPTPPTSAECQIGFLHVEDNHKKDSLYNKEQGQVFKLLRMLVKAHNTVEYFGISDISGVKNPF